MKPAFYQNMKLISELRVKKAVFRAFSVTTK